MKVAVCFWHFVPPSDSSHTSQTGSPSRRQTPESASSSSALHPFSPSPVQVKVTSFKAHSMVTGFPSTITVSPGFRHREAVASHFNPSFSFSATAASQADVSSMTPPSGTSSDPSTTMSSPSTGTPAQTYTALHRRHAPPGPSSSQVFSPFGSHPASSNFWQDNAASASGQETSTASFQQVPVTVVVWPGQFVTGISFGFESRQLLAVIRQP